jgi:hypothetical protein
MKWRRTPAGRQPTNGVLGNKVLTLATRVQLCREDPTDGRQGQRRAVEDLPCKCPFCESEPPQESSLPLWAGPATRCLNAYVKQDYSACVAAGREALSLQIIPTVGLVTLLALRRQGLFVKAERFSRALLRCGVGPGGMLFLLLMLLDGALNPEQFLKERFFAGFRVGVSRELECQVYFYWGAKLLTEGRFTIALKPLVLCVCTECDALERVLANADLAIAQALHGKVN